VIAGDEGRWGYNGGHGAYLCWNGRSSRNEQIKGSVSGSGVITGLGEPVTRYGRKGRSDHKTLTLLGRADTSRNTNQLISSEIEIEMSKRSGPVRRKGKERTTVTGNTKPWVEELLKEEGRIDGKK